MSFRAWLKRLFAFFFRLQWKLTISYTLVTVAMLSILLVAMIFVGNLMTSTYPQTTVMLAQAMQNAARGLAPALQQDPPDVKAVDTWISETFQGRSILINNQGADTEYSLSYSSLASSTTLLVVLDEHGRVVSSNQPDIAPAGNALPAEIPSSSRGLVQRAYAGERGLSQLFVRESGRQTIVSPILDNDEQVLGIILLVLDQPNQFELLWLSLVAILPWVLIFTVLAGLIGSAFGALIARGLTRRLRNAMQTTSAWGKGDFSARVSDRQQDEIGQLARELNRMADELQELMRTRQELAAMEERNRLARELHDSAKQQVFATSMNLAAARKLWDANPEEARKRVDIAADLSRQSQQELTALIQTLHPVQLDRHQLAQALGDTVKAWSRQNGIPAEFAVYGPSCTLPSEVEQVLFRVTQEALSNAARHSGATGVRVELHQAKGSIRLQIEDNGHGFDPGQPARGLGLRFMQERIHAVGGSLNITSCPGATRLTAQVPLENHREGMR